VADEAPSSGKTDWLLSGDRFWGRFFFARGSSSAPKLTTRRVCSAQPGRRRPSRGLTR
jgi:hypothetical protein